MNLTFENKGFIDTYEFSLAKAANGTLVFTEETITAGEQKFELHSGQKESFFAYRGGVSCK